MDCSFLKIVVLTTFMLTNYCLRAQEQPLDNNPKAIQAVDTLPETNLQYKISKNSIDCIVNRRSDSSRYNAKTKIVELYGNAVIEYCEMRLEADEIHYNTQTGDAEAFSVKDSLGNITKYALFTDGQQEMQYEYLRYNFKSQKGNVKTLVTKQGDGVVWGKKVKQIEPGQYYVKGTRYSTCNLEHPHYYFTFDKAKIKNKKFAAGKNLNLYIKDIPTPLYFPFAIFPLERGKRAGFTRPRVGYDRERGFALQNVGWYQPINDNMDASLAADFYTSGSWNFNTRYRFQQKYKYRVNLDFGYSTVKGFDVSDALGLNLQNSYQVNLSFNQDPKVWKNSNLNATISLGQRNFKQINVTNPTDRLNNQYNSSISFNTKFPNSPFSLASNLRYNQNTQSKKVNLSLPELNFSMSTIYPLRGLNKTGKQGLFDNLNMNFRSNFRNSLESADSLFFDNPIQSIGDNSIYGARHSLPIAASFKVAKYFTFTPNISYTESWTSRNYNYSWDGTQVVRDTTNTFRRAGWYSTGVGFNTRIYGMRQFNKGKLYAIRHVMTPTFSFNYNPDFTNLKSNGDAIFYNVQVDTLGNTRQYSLFEGAPFGGPPSSSGGSVGFNLGNNLEMKIRSDKDSTGFEKIKIFESLNLSTSYNLKADSLNLSPFIISGNTKLLKRINVNINGQFNPYAVDPKTGRTINTFSVKNGPLVDFVSGGFRISGSLNSKSSDEEQVKQINLINNPLYPGEQLFADNYFGNYIDLSVPWNVRLGYNLRYSKSYQPNDKRNYNVTNAVTANGNFNLTDEWRINYSTGYDFRKKELNYTNIGIQRDLHCWQMGFSWSPIGNFRQYNFVIQPKSSLLRGFKVEKKRTIYDNFN